MLVFFILQKFTPFISHAAFYCQTLFKLHMVPVPYLVSVAPLVILAIVFVIALSKFGILIAKTHYFRRTLQVNITTEKRLRILLKRLRLEEKTVVIQTQEKLAFCLGIKRPKIYLSTGLLTQLSLKEIEVILRHEQYHVDNHDTLIMILALLTHSLFPFFPLLGDLIMKYRIEREVAADNFAVQSVGETASLLSVFKKFLSSPTVGSLALAAIADQDTLEHRIYTLTNRRYTQRHFRLKHLVITVFSSLCFILVTISPVHANDMHRNGDEYTPQCVRDWCRNSCMSDSALSQICTVHQQLSTK